MFKRHIRPCLFLLLYVNIAAMDIVHVSRRSAKSMQPEKSSEPSDVFIHRLYKPWSGIIVDDTNLPMGRHRHIILMMTEIRRYSVCLRCIISLWMLLWMFRASKY